MTKKIIHCADDLSDPKLLVVLYAFKDGEERSLRYCSIGSAAMMVAYIMTTERGWKTRIIVPSPERQAAYLSGRREIHCGCGI